MARSVLRWQPGPGSRALSRAAMEVAFRGVRKILCVAEKNDAAKGIADLLSGGRMRRVRRCPGLPGPRLRRRRLLLPAGSAKLCSRLRLRGSLPTLCGRASSAHSLENLCIPPFAPQQFPDLSDLGNSRHRLAYGVKSGKPSFISQKFRLGTTGQFLLHYIKFQFNLFLEP